MPFYSVFTVYDRINGEAAAPYADYLDRTIRLDSDIPVQDVLDLGCGTGKITALMADKGYGMIGVDLSPEMLNLARENNEGKNTLLLLQDMRSFELYGTVQAVYSSFDCLNYLHAVSDLQKVFRLVANYLEPGGLFLFDVNTEYRYREVYADRTFFYEYENELLLWRNEPVRAPGDPSGGLRGTRFVLDYFFAEKARGGEDGLYRRRHEEMLQTFHPEERLLRCAEETGFVLVRRFGDPEGDRAEKTFYVLKKREG